MNPRRRDRRPRSWLRASVLALVLCLAAIAGCAGGSGSSGFDIVENAAIDQALDEQRCVESGGLVICPAETEPGMEPAPTSTPRPTATATPPFFPSTPTQTPERPEDSRTPSVDTTATPTPTGPRPSRTVAPATVTPTEGGEPTEVPTEVPTDKPTEPPTKPRIDIGLDRNSFVDCLDAGGECGFSFVFKADGFPPDTTFLVASRRLAPDSPWQISEPAEVDPSTGVRSFDALITIPVDDQTSVVTVQVAILARSAPVGAAPSSVDALADSNADSAYVTPELQVRPIR